MRNSSSNLTISKNAQPVTSKKGQLLNEIEVKWSPPRLRLIQWFYNLPIRQKQLIGLFASEVISIVGLVGVGAYLIVRGGRNQLVNQAKSELAVTEIHYNIKINQMGFGFRGQSDNAAIIELAHAYHEGREIDRDLEESTIQILKNELRARDIEYATLVGADLKIVANANLNRKGEYFNPNQLVEIALETGEQIKTSEQIDWPELAAESPSYLRELAPGSPVLIRYTVTPVKHPETREPIAVLVSGDIVDRKNAIVQLTLKTLDGGYSAVYLRDRNSQEFRLSTSAKQANPNSSQSARAAVYSEYLLDYELPSHHLLEQAIESELPVPVTERVKLAETYYTIAAKALYNHQGEAIAVLVRGTPELALEALTEESLFFQGTIACLALAVDILLAIVLGITITRPIKRLQEATQSFSQGNLQARSPVMSRDEVGSLAKNFNSMARRILKAFEQIKQHTESQAELNAELLEEIQYRQAVEDALRKSQRDLELAKQTAESANGAKSEFLANMSHELRTPLNGILGYAQILERNPQVMQEHGQAVSVIYQCGSHLLTLINDVLDLSKIEARKLELVEDEVDFPRFLQGIVDLFHVRAQSQNLRLNYQLKTELPAIAIVDEKRLRQVLINLLGNAVKFTDTGSVTFTVEVLSYGELAQIRFAIADTGVGMSEKQIEKIFVPFEQVGEQAKKSQGTGLGLPISRQIVQLMGSDIEVSSILGEGSVFQFILNLDYDNVQTMPLQHGTPSHIIGYEGDRRQIWVISSEFCNFEDERLCQRPSFLQDLLDSLGFSTVVSETSEQGLSQVHNIDLVMFDTEMSPETIQEQIVQLRSQEGWATMPMLIALESSQSLAPDIVEEMENTGAITQPIILEQFFAEIQRLLQLEWVYDETSDIETGDRHSQALADKMMMPSAEILNYLLHLSQQGNLKQIIREVDALATADPNLQPFVTQVRELAQNFEEDQLIALLTQS